MSKQILTTLNRLKKLAYSQLKIEQAEFFEDVAKTITDLQKQIKQLKADKK